MNSSRAVAQDRPIFRMLGPLAIAVFTAIMLVITWRRWPDILVDFGAQMYTAWELAIGKRLYVDVAHVYGPLSPYLCAAACRVFGTSILTVAMLNLAILIAILTLTYRLLTIVGDRLAATVACLVFVGVFAFGQYTLAGNYNFICPYVAEAAHGLLLAVLAITMFHRYLVTRRRGSIFAAGVFAGLVLLTKYELVLATAAALVIGLLLELLRARDRRMAIDAAIVAVGIALVPVLTLLTLSLAISPHVALHAITGAFPLLARRELLDLRFYREGLGLDDAGASIGLLVQNLGWYLLLLGPLIGALWVRKKRAPIAVLIATYICAVVLTALLRIDWPQIARPFPLLLVALAVWIALQLHAHWLDEARPLWVSRLMLILFSLVMLAKMILNARVTHYGFVLALPAALVIVTALSSWIPQQVQSRGGDRALFIAAMLGVLSVAVAIHLRGTWHNMAERTFPVGKGGDMIYASPARSHLFERTLLAIEQSVPRDRTLCVMPEGVMLNYLTRRSSSIPYLAFLPSDLAMFGEDRVLKALAEHPPDFIVVYPKNIEEYGRGQFGSGYARNIAAWIGANYHATGTISAGSDTVLFLTRNPATTTP